VGDDLRVKVLGVFLDSGVGGEDRLLGIEDLFDPDAEFRPKVFGEIEIRAKIEHSSLTNFRADSFRFDQPVGEVRAPVAG
jgi:hypothetical protein